MASVLKLFTRQMSSAKLAASINNVTIIGGGLMGSGIAQVGRNISQMLLFFYLDSCLDNMNTLFNFLINFLNGLIFDLSEKY